MIRNKTINLWWILDDLIGVSCDNEVQCVPVNMSWLGDMLPKTNRLQEIEQLERVRVINNINVDIEYAPP